MLTINDLLIPSYPQALYCSVRCSGEDHHHHSGAECGLPWPRLLQEETLLAVRLATLSSSSSGGGSRIVEQEEVGAHHTMAAHLDGLLLGYEDEVQDSELLLVWCLQVLPRMSGGREVEHIIPFELDAHICSSRSSDSQVI